MGGHRLAGIGEGYLWPFVTIYSDGVRALIVSDPSPPSSNEVFRYEGVDIRPIISAESLGLAIDGFVGNIVERLDAASVHETNLHSLVEDLHEERTDLDLARFRRMEAQLGCDPDVVDENVIYSAIGDLSLLGEDAWGELAVAGWVNPCQIACVDRIRDMARTSGFDLNSQDAASLNTPVRGYGEEAWQLGEAAARALRTQEGLGEQPVSNNDLAAMAGVSTSVFSSSHLHKGSDDSLAFTFEDGGVPQVVFNSRKWETGRRFELARLLGDRILAQNSAYTDEIFFPATGSRSYRQKAQCAFAAELLSPSVVANAIMMEDEYSEESQKKAAEHFNVSEMTIRTQLVNQGRLDRADAPDVEFRRFAWAA